MQEAARVQSMATLVAAGLGVSLVPESTAVSFTAPETVVVHLTRPVPMVELAVAWRKDDRSPPVAAFLEVLRGHVPRKRRPRPLRAQGQ